MRSHYGKKEKRISINLISVFKLDSDAELLADVWQERHHAGAFDGKTGCTLKSGTVSTTLTGEDFVLVGAKLLEEPNVFVIDECWTGAALRRAESTAVFAVTT
jgi:hypothetical protein